MEKHRDNMVMGCDRNHTVQVQVKTKWIEKKHGRDVRKKVIRDNGRGGYRLGGQRDLEASQHTEFVFSIFSVADWSHVTQ